MKKLRKLATNTTALMSMISMYSAILASAIASCYAGDGAVEAASIWWKVCGGCLLMFVLNLALYIFLKANEKANGL